jgi:hypothetical protein
MQEIDELTAGACVLCRETAIKQIDKAFCHRRGRSELSGSFESILLVESPVD